MKTLHGLVVCQCFIKGTFSAVVVDVAIINIIIIGAIERLEQIGILGYI
jgi:hypothetical protein